MMPLRVVPRTRAKLMRKETSESSEGGREGVRVEVHVGVFYGRTWTIVNDTEGKQ